MKSEKKSSKTTFKSFLNVLKITFQGFTDDKVMKLSASLAYATIFAIIPFITLIVTLGTFFQQDVSSLLYGKMDDFLGAEGIEQLKVIIKNASATDKSALATIMSFGIMIFGATTIFAEMQTSINSIWGIKPKPKRGWLMYLQNRVLSFSIILVLGFLLLVTLSLSTLINSLSQQLMTYFPDVTAILFQAIGMIINIVVISILFILIFKILPDAKIKFRDVIVGGVATTFLFLVGQFAISFYLGTRNITSIYGAAALILVLLSWIYYSSVIIYIGAEFTKAWANEKGGRIYPEEYAVSMKIVEIVDDGSVQTINKTEIDNSSDEDKY